MADLYQIFSVHAWTATLNLVLQQKHGHVKLLWIAYRDLKAAFDSVNPGKLRQLLTSLAVPPKIVNLMKQLYADTTSCVRYDGIMCDWFYTPAGIKQGCTVWQQTG